MALRDCKIINLPKISDPRGNLTFIEGEHHIPFEIKRVYYLYDVPGGAERGAHGRSVANGLQGANGSAVLPYTNTFTIANPGWGTIEAAANGSVASAGLLSLVESPVGTGFFIGLLSIR